MPPASQTIHTFRVMPLVTVMLTGVKIGIATGFGVAALAGWEMHGVLPGVLAGLVWTVAAAFGAMLLVLVSQRQSDRLAFAWLAGSGARMFVALLLGLFVTLVFKPDAKVFWVCFLIAGLCCLVFETVWAVRVLRRQVPAPHAISSGVSST